MRNLDKFMEAYARHLLAVVSDPEQEYAYGPAQVPAVVAKMRAAFERNSYNLDGVALRRTCKEFSIPHTRKAINAFLEERES